MSRDDYIEVADRLQEFLRTFPDGSPKGDPGPGNRTGQQWSDTREAYRTP